MSSPLKFDISVGQESAHDKDNEEWNVTECSETLATAQKQPKTKTDADVTLLWSSKVLQQFLMLKICACARFRIYLQSQFASAIYDITGCQRRYVNPIRLSSELEGDKIIRTLTHIGLGDSVRIILSPSSRVVLPSVVKILKSLSDKCNSAKARYNKLTVRMRLNRINTNYKTISRRDESGKR